MLTRRKFLKGCLLSTVAVGALVKNGIVQPSDVIEEPKRRVFDMAENTWRRDQLLGYPVEWVDNLPPLRLLWPPEWSATINGEWWPKDVENPWIPGYEVGAPVTARYDGYEMQGVINSVSIEGGIATIQVSSVGKYSLIDNFGISSSEVAERVRGIPRTECVQVWEQAVKDYAREKLADANET